MSTPVVQCTACGAQLTIPPGRVMPAGAQARCPRCNGVVRLQATQSMAAPGPTPSTRVAATPGPSTQSQSAPASAPRTPSVAAAAPQATPAAEENPFASVWSDIGDEPAVPARPARPAPPERPAYSARAASNRSSRLPLYIGGAIAVIGITVAIIIVSVSGKRSDSSPKVAENPPVKEKKLPTPKDKDRTGTTGKELPRKDPAVGGQGLTDEVLDKVKRATVYIRVVTGDGRGGTGSGFFESGTGLIVTNAHVLGMLEQSTLPQYIECILNSGQPTETRVRADVAAVDRQSDLAFLEADMGSVPIARKPPQLSVENAASLKETQRVYVFGFPLGEALGKNITISETTVSSLRSDDRGSIDKVQVNGGMHPGNSGGPVVDGKGSVVGVAVSGIRGTSINFAVPREKVKAMLGGQ